MKILKLTPDQYKKLLELTRKYFKEFPIISMSAHYVLLQTERRPANKTNGNISIHWYQFCMTLLSDRILNDKEYAELVYSEHPIDFLWDIANNKS